MTVFCLPCGHPRLLHDSWGCMVKCGCGVSIIYLVPGPLVELVDQEVLYDLIKQGNELVVMDDLLAESHVVEMRERSLREIAPHPPLN